MRQSLLLTLFNLNLYTTAPRIAVPFKYDVSFKALKTSKKNLKISQNSLNFKKCVN